MLNPRYEGWEENECWTNHWKYPNHEFSTHGRIRNKKTGHILRPMYDKDGYEVISIGSVDNVRVHIAIMEAWFGSKPFPNAEVNHIDLNRANNHYLNLEWTTSKGNIEWAMMHGTIDWQKGLDRAVEINRLRVRVVETGEEFDSIKSCADYLGVPPTNISRVLSGSRTGQRIHGYHLEYVDESKRRCNRR